MTRKELIYKIEAEMEKHPFWDFTDMSEISESVVDIFYPLYESSKTLLQLQNELNIQNQILQEIELAIKNIES